MRTQDLPDRYKLFVVHLSNGHNYTINGEAKKIVLSSPKNFVELPDGSVINKSFIIDIKLDKLQTKDRFLQLPEKERESVLSQIVVKK